jgi:hypothetical protein
MKNRAEVSKERILAAANIDDKRNLQGNFYFL